jgi:hypothetical protein
MVQGGGRNEVKGDLPTAPESPHVENTRCSPFELDQRKRTHLLQSEQARVFASSEFDDDQPRAAALMAGGFGGRSEHDLYDHARAIDI